MIVSYRVVSLAFTDRPDWEVLGDHVPIGKVYHILDESIKRCTLMNKLTLERREVTAGIDIETGRYIPLDTLELIDS